MAEMATASPQPETSNANSASPPPNCAICLGNCINKCFSDSCMHQFCFKCLLEWSKVKAVCPLCKQPFTSIIHNVKSNNEYDEHFITTNSNNSQEPTYPRDFIDPQAYDFFVTPASHRFQFRADHHGQIEERQTFIYRTTFTVDPRGELAIQQLLSTHPLTNSFHLSIPPVPNSYMQRQHLRRFQSDYSSTNFRRYIYEEDMWVHALPDITGRFRDVSPQFFRENPVARNRLVPWLNRELNALLYENTQQVMYVVDVILSQLDRHHLTSRYFNQLLDEYFGNRTDHFIHEFYNFMRSPYDMIGYDRQVCYSHALRLRIDSSDDDEDDSDVVLVPNTEPTAPVVIEINSDSSRDSDVIIREPTPPTVVNLVDTDSNHSANGSTSEKPLLPLKIRLKRKRQNREKKSRRRTMASSSSSGSISSGTSSNESDSSYVKVKPKRKYKKSKYYIVKNSESDSDTDNQSLNKLKKEWEDRKRKKAKKSKRKQKLKNSNARTNGEVVPNDSLCKNENVDSDQSGSYTPPPRITNVFSNICVEREEIVETTDTQSVKNDDEDRTFIKSESEVNPNKPGPSSNNLSTNEPPINTWYSRPPIFTSGDDSD